MFDPKEAGELGGAALVQAEVVGPVEKQWCRVRFASDSVEPERWVRIALPGPWRPREGDVVLVARSGDAAYVIGILEAAPECDTPSESEARVYRDGRGADERLGVCDESGRMLFEYRPAQRRAVLSVPDGDLELRAAGHLDLVSGERVRAFAARGLELESAGPLSLRSGGDASAAALRLDDTGAALSAPRVAIEARDAALRLERLRGQVDDAQLEAGVLRLAVRHLETVAERIVQRAQSLQQVVQGLHQLTAGRLRQLVDGALQCRAGRLDLRGRRGVKLDGEKIHLG